MGPNFYQIQLSNKKDDKSSVGVEMANSVLENSGLLESGYSFAAKTLNTKGFAKGPHHRLI